MCFGLYRIKVFNNLRFTENQACLSIVYCMCWYMILKDLICLFSSYLISNQEVKGREKKVTEQQKKSSSQSSEKHCNRRFMPDRDPRNPLIPAECSRKKGTHNLVLLQEGTIKCTKPCARSFSSNLAPLKSLPIPFSSCSYWKNLMDSRDLLLLVGVYKSP